MFFLGCVLEECESYLFKALNCIVDVNEVGITLTRYPRFPLSQNPRLLVSLQVFRNRAKPPQCFGLKVKMNVRQASGSDFFANKYVCAWNITFPSNLLLSSRRSFYCLTVLRYVYKHMLACMELLRYMTVPKNNCFYRWNRPLVLRSLKLVIRWHRQGYRQSI
ncbi:hypothetical protein BDQ17DRAFT_542454 [Cyathus striatus]|nr:hypothetical protein BDQ17DRAFT_542454 [Cyathus striatus]